MMTSFSPCSSWHELNELVIRYRRIIEDKNIPLEREHIREELFADCFNIGNIYVCGTEAVIAIISAYSDCSENADMCTLTANECKTLRSTYSRTNALLPTPSAPFTIAKCICSADCSEMSSAFRPTNGQNACDCGVGAKCVGGSGMS